MKMVKIEIKCVNYQGLLNRLSALREDIELFSSILKENGMNLGDTNKNGESYSLRCDCLEEEDQ